MTAFKFKSKMNCRKNLSHITLLLVFLVSFQAFEIQATTSEDSTESSVKKLVIAISRDTVPFHFIDEKGNPAGIIVNLWRLWSQKTGIAVEFKNASWHDTLAMVRDGQADVHAGMNYNPERDEYLDFTTAWSKSDSYIFFHNNIIGINGVDD